MIDCSPIIQSLYPYQREVFFKLKELSIKDPHMHVLIQVPTGGGKTRIAAAYALTEFIEQDRSIVWFAHSKFLLEQAYETFKELLGILGSDGNEELYKSYIKSHSKIIHSKSNHSVFDLKRNKKEIVFLSVPTAAGYYYEDAIPDNAIIIIDEAHHSVAETHKMAYHDLAKCRTTIGLTATPTRVLEHELPKLFDFYRTSLIANVTVDDLITMGTLVRMEYIRAKPLSFSSGDDRLESCKMVVENYITNKDLYGKTIIFALDQQFALDLLQTFHDAKQCPIWITYSECYNNHITLFRNSNVGVLINVEQLTEGIDIPDVKTVILANCPKSFIAITQMLGRAMRKPKGSDKDIAYVVDFTKLPDEDVMKALYELTSTEACKTRAVRAYNNAHREPPDSLK